MFFHVSSSSLRQWFATLSCSLGSGLTASSVMAYNSILVESLQKDPDTNFTFEETSWFCKHTDSFVLEIHNPISASCWAFTAILGCFVGGIISDMAGRRKVIIISVIPFIIGSIMVTKLKNPTIRVLLTGQKCSIFNARIKSCVSITELRTMVLYLGVFVIGKNTPQLMCTECQFRGKND